MTAMGFGKWWIVNSIFSETLLVIDNHNDAIKHGIWGIFNSLNKGFTQTKPLLCNMQDNDLVNRYG